MPSLSLGLLAERTGAVLRGDPQLLIHGVNEFHAARPGEITLAADERHVSKIASSSAAAFIVPEQPVLPDGVNLLLTRYPKLVFARAIALFREHRSLQPGIDPNAKVAANASVHPEASLQPHVTVGALCRVGARTVLHPGVVLMDEVEIGEDCVLFPNVVVYPRCRLGDRVTIHGGTVIGADGFGFVPDEQGHQVKIPQTGMVLIENDVEIGANCCIDRATFGSTVIRAGVKLDNLIQVAHNCDIGEDTVIAAQAGFSGSTRVGRRVVIAGQAATNDHVTIGDGVVVGGQAGVTKDVPGGMFVAGTPAVHHRDWKRSQVLALKLPDLVERIRHLEEQIPIEPNPASKTSRPRRK